MTQIDRYILTLFFRTVLVCFLSLAGVFVVFHAFTNMDQLLDQTRNGDSLVAVTTESNASVEEGDAPIQDGRVTATPF